MLIPPITGVTYMIVGFDSGDVKGKQNKIIKTFYIKILKYFFFK